MRTNTSITELIQKIKQGDIISSSMLLAGADFEFTEKGREYLLTKALDPIKEKYTHIIIDSPPTLGILTVNALVACTDIIIPLTADIFALQGLSQLSSTINKIEKFCNKSIKIAGLLICRFSGRSILSRELKDVIDGKATEMKTELYNTFIREGVAIREAQTQSTSVFDYAPSSNPAIDYDNFIIEYLNQKEK
jgi:chromosome partitioning protein